MLYHLWKAYLHVEQNQSRPAAKEIPTESAVNTRVILCPHSLPVISIVIASMLAIPT